MEIQEEGDNEGLRDELIVKKGELWALYLKQEREWMQKSRIKWVRKGDRNTRYFHAMASIIRRVNRMDKIKGVDGMKEIPEAIKGEVERHFQNLYNVKEVLELINLDCNLEKLKPESASFLEKPSKEEEVWGTIQGCDGNKALRPDGYNLNFFKNQWEVVKDDIIDFMKKFYKNGQLGYGVNSSFIALISKVQNPNNLSEYKSISLVGSLYKIVAKTLADCLRMVIGKVIGKNQFAFIKRRQLIDCSFITNEIVDSLKKGAEGGVILKVDFEKAYDSVS
ncbi:uncharacterized protein LOC110419572 [Herrania umbratica]|uniref:Uncharacterized protein LOC110419572 n=1 Tax=Herrania umbratica TaxID=108875 RepID=A0A6J1AN12_9ROSI|nr:uncharacterized protein LOC110419572 [Herrania umbratica]